MKIGATLRLHAEPTLEIRLFVGFDHGFLWARPRRHETCRWIEWWEGNGGHQHFLKLTFCDDGDDDDDDGDDDDDDDEDEDEDEDVVDDDVEDDDIEDDGEDDGEDDQVEEDEDEDDNAEDGGGW